jgi:hypothetical protein
LLTLPGYTPVNVEFVVSEADADVLLLVVFLRNDDDATHKLLVTAFDSSKGAIGLGCDDFDATSDGAKNLFARQQARLADPENEHAEAKEVVWPPASFLTGVFPIEGLVYSEYRDSSVNMSIVEQYASDAGAVKKDGKKGRRRRLLVVLSDDHSVSMIALAGLLEIKNGVSDRPSPRPRQDATVIRVGRDSKACVFRLSAESEQLRAATAFGRVMPRTFGSWSDVPLAFTDDALPSELDDNDKKEDGATDPFLRLLETAAESGARNPVLDAVWRQARGDGDVDQLLWLVVAVASEENVGRGFQSAALRLIALPEFQASPPPDATFDNLFPANSVHNVRCLDSRGKSYFHRSSQQCRPRFMKEKPLGIGAVDDKALLHTTEISGLTSRFKAPPLSVVGSKWAFAGAIGDLRSVLTRPAGGTKEECAANEQLTGVFTQRIIELFQ